MYTIVVHQYKWFFFFIIEKELYIFFYDHAFRDMVFQEHATMCVFCVFVLPGRNTTVRREFNAAVPRLNKYSFLLVSTWPMHISFSVLPKGDALSTHSPNTQTNPPWTQLTSSPGTLYLSRKTLPRSQGTLAPQKFYYYVGHSTISPRFYR